jgi:hypothetical protein
MGAPTVDVVKADKFNRIEVISSWKVVSSALVGWGIIFVKGNISFNVCW